MASQLVIKPTFLLKGIDPIALQERYTTEHLSTLSLAKKKIVAVTLNNNKGKSFRDALFCFRNRDNFLQTIATTGAKFFSFEGEEERYRCMGCHREFTGRSLGIPVSLRKIDRDNILVYKIGQTHDFPCTLRLIRSLLQTRRNPNLEHAEELLHFLYNKMHPQGPPLRPSPDPLLLISTGGSLSEEEYEDGQYNYVPVPNLILYPAKEQYLRLQRQ
jgi:hypothetical protein